MINRKGFFYLETVVRHVPVPFFAVRQDGTLSLVNNPARKLTGLSALHRLDQLAELEFPAANVPIVEAVICRLNSLI